MKTLLSLTLIGCSLTTMRAETKMEYPESKRTEFSETLHGQEVADPYRWLEDIDSEPVQEWVEAQADFAQKYIEKLPGRDRIEKRLTELWDYEKHGLPHRMAGKLFYTKNSGLQNQSVLYWRPEKEGEEDRLLLDPNKLSEDGTVALSGYAVSYDGRHLAYGISRSGSDWQEWKIREVETGKDLDDELKNIKFSSASWSKDNRGFAYGKYNPSEEGDLKESNVDQKVYYHRIGDTQEKDELLYERPDQPKWMFDAEYSEDGRYLILIVSTGASSKNGVFYRDLEDPEGKVVELINDFEAEYSFVGNEGSTFFIRTDRGAPNGRLVAINTAEPAEEHWKELIPARPEALESVGYVGEHFIASYLKDVVTQVVIFDKEGKEVREVELPEMGSAYGFGGLKEDTETYYILTSFTNPGRIYRYDLISGKSEPFWQADLKFNPDDYTTKQVFYPSKDGTKIPMFLVHRKDLEMNGQRPTFLYAYGGFNISLTPSFSVGNLVWMEMGGVFALANLRGGGEYGMEWHEAGMGLNKQNVFDDFIAGAEWLIDSKVTNSKKLAIGGGSNGGLLTAACLNQRPDLFGAVWTAVGVQDMLRFHTFTIGWAWQDEYGNVEEKEHFQNLLGYSPYHNVKEGVAYPPTLITTADHDDRVFPAHSFKYGAALQHAQAGAAPIILRIETKAGHGAGKPTSKAIEEIADRWAFIAKALDMKSDELSAIPKEDRWLVVLHGLGRTSLSMRGVARRLQDHYEGVINFGYPSRSKSIQQLVDEHLAPTLAEIQKHSPARIDFVTHSMGGILVRDYLSRYELPNIGRVVMLAPPNHGSEIPDQLRKCCLFETIMGPASVQLGTDPDSVPNRLGPASFDLGIITGDVCLPLPLARMVPRPNDGKVSVESSRLEGMKDHLVLPYAHSFIMNFRKTKDNIEAFLETGGFLKSDERSNETPLQQATYP